MQRSTRGTSCSAPAGVSGSQPGRRSTSLVSGGRKKVHSTLADGSELVEEFDARTDELLVRKRRQRSLTGALQAWSIEVGHADDSAQPGAASAPAAVASANSNFVIRESNGNPVLVRKDAGDVMQFRIRNLFDPPEVYDVSVDEQQQQLVVRTSNKKYFKRISIPDLSESGIALDARNVQWSHANNTLLIQYCKPPALLELEEKARRERAHMQFQEDGEMKSDCKQQ